MTQDHSIEAVSSLRLLAKAIAGQSVDFTGADETGLFRIAGNHGVLPILNERVHEGTISGLDENSLLQLQAQTKKQIALDMVLNNATGQFCRLLAENDVRALLLKGTPVAHIFYPQTWLRTRCDTDVYISVEDSQRCAEVLRASGYEVVGLNPDQSTSKQFQACREQFQGDRMWFDIHYRLSNRGLFQQTLKFEQCWSRRQDVPDLKLPEAKTPGVHALTLCHTDLLIHAAIHRIAHGRNSDRNRLIWLYDIHLMIEGQSSKSLQNLVAFALERKVGCVLADALVACRTMFSTRFPQQLPVELEQNRNSEPTAKLIDAGKWRWAWEDLSGQAGLAGKLKFAGELLSNQFNKSAT